MTKCELCELDWHDDTLSQEELAEDEEHIKIYHRCLSCYEEWGDGWPDQ